MSNTLFLSDDGNLYRDGEFSAPLREQYCYPFSEIENGKQLRATLRYGEFTKIGGYRLAFITADGAILSFDAVRDNLHSVLWSLRNNVNDGWKVNSYIVVDNCDYPVYCDHSGELLNGE